MYENYKFILQEGNYIQINISINYFHLDVTWLRFEWKEHIIKSFKERGRLISCQSEEFHYQYELFFSI